MFENHRSLLDYGNILAAIRTSFRARNVIIAARSAVHHLDKWGRIFRCKGAIVRYLATSKERRLFCYLVNAVIGSTGREFVVLISKCEVVTSYTRLVSIISGSSCAYVERNRTMTQWYQLWFIHYPCHSAVCCSSIECADKTRYQNYQIWAVNIGCSLCFVYRTE
jgi:hypothetical protein